MPRIAEIVTLPDGRPAVVVEIEGDQGSLTIWSEVEVNYCKRRAAEDEREACAKWAQDLVNNSEEPMTGEQVANAIRNGSNPYST